MNTAYRWTAVVLGIALELAAASCQGGAAQATSQKPISASAEMYAEVDALPLPDEVDAALFRRLQSALKRALATVDEKRVSRPPEGDANRVNDLHLTDNHDGTCTLRWHYRNVGDYDQNGTVAIADITPLAVHFGETVVQGDANSLAAVVDGSGNSRVDISDVTPIAMHFGSECAGYRVEGAPESGAFSMITLVDMDAAQDAAMARARFSQSVSIGSSVRFRVVPVDSQVAEGLPSNEVSIMPLPPSIESVSPLTGETGNAVTFSAVVSGSQPFTYAWEFGAAGTPATSTLATPMVTLGAVSEYPCSLEVTNAYGSDTFPFTLTVTEPQEQPLELWYFQMVNLLPDANVDSALALMEEAKGYGYTKAVIADFKFGTIDIQSDHYRENVARFAQGAEDLGVEVIPSLVPIGYSDAFLCHNPNLIEGMPVVEADFLVQDVGGQKTADVVQDAAISNGGFETPGSGGSDVFDYWYEMDPCSADTSDPHSGSYCVRFNPSGGANSRITTPDVVVKPWNYYVIKLWLKTQSAVPAGSIWFRVFNYDPTPPGTLTQICFQEFSVQTTQGWKEYILTFNSQEYSTIRLYLGMWGGQSGQFWFDDVSMENAGLVNLIRRDGAPLTVKSADGFTTYTEGSDYDYVEDPLMGHAGSYTGTFDLYHEPRPVITVPATSPIQVGDHLRVSYYHCAFVYDLQPTVCLTEDETYTIAHDTLSLVNDIINPSQVFIAIDEMRVANWCEGCQSTGKTPGQLLADCAQQLDGIAHGINLDWTLLTWSDMFDPYHNAHDNYYLVNGTLEGSWEGLPAAWDIGNWRHFGDPVETIAFFADRGHRQVLAGYYDEPATNFTIDEWLTDAQGYPGVYAVMYTTWQNDYSDLQAWAQCVRDWEAAQ